MQAERLGLICGPLWTKETDMCEFLWGHISVRRLMKASGYKGQHGVDAKLNLLNYTLQRNRNFDDESSLLMDIAESDASWHILPRLGPCRPRRRQILDFHEKRLWKCSHRCQNIADRQIKDKLC